MVSLKITAQINARFVPNIKRIPNLAESTRQSSNFKAQAKIITPNLEKKKKKNRVNVCQSDGEVHAHVVFYNCQVHKSYSSVEATEHKYRPCIGYGGCFVCNFRCTLYFIRSHSISSSAPQQECFNASTSCSSSSLFCLGRRYRTR